MNNPRETNIINIRDNKDSWAQIQKPGRPGSMKLKRCSANFQLDHYLGVNYFGQYLYVLKLPTDVLDDKSLCFPEVAGCCHYLKGTSEETDFSLALQNNDRWPIFKMLILMIIEETEKVHRSGTHQILATVSSVMDRCRSFFRQHGGGFTRKKAIGLLGELIFLKDCVVPVVGWREALSCWKGPLGNPQDFVVRNSCIEVKTTEVGQPSRIIISNLDQLNPVADEEYVCVVAICQAETSTDTDVSYTLHSIIEELSNGISSACGDDMMFCQMLELTGYEKESPESKVRYNVRKKTFYIADENFPHIDRSMLMPGIESVKYVIDLSVCVNNIKSPDWIS